MRIAVAVLIASTATARADVETFPLASLPITLGTHRTASAGTFSWSVRPEVIASRIRWGSWGEPAGGWGLGGYAQVERSDEDTMYAGGLTLVGYAGKRAIAPSVGLYHRNDADRGVQASLFFGRRTPLDRDLPLDIPFGVRVDLMLAGDPRARSIIISAQLDTSPLFVLLGGIAAILGRGE